MAVEAKGRPVEVFLTPGQQHEASVAKDLIDVVEGENLLADSAYDSDEIVEKAKSKNMKPVIANRPNRKSPRRLKRKLYSLRYKIECSFHGLKRFRRFATRYDKTACNFLAMVHVACLLFWI